MKIKVATYNVHNTDGGESLSGIAREIVLSGAEIVGLQEIDYFTERSGKIDMMKELSVLTGMKGYAFCRAIDYDGGQYGIGILTKHKLLQVDTREIPSGKEQRVCAHAKIDVGDRVIDFFNTHLSLESDRRILQLNIINELLGKSRPFILTGDFNTCTIEEFGIIKNAVYANSSEHEFNTFRTGGKIDNIIASGDLDVEDIFMSYSDYSDHNMLVCDVFFK